MRISPRKADILIAEKLFGRKVEFVKVLDGYRWPDMKPDVAEYPVIIEEGTFAYYDVDGVKLNVVPNYCTDFEAAFEIVEKLVIDKGLNMDIVMVSENPRSFKVCFGNVEAIGGTIPLAIVNTALKWLGIDAEASFEIEEEAN